MTGHAAMTTDQPPFQRENRYLVIKRRDILAALTDTEAQILQALTHKVMRHRHDAGKPGQMECVVVESDWPEYEPTWAAIEARVTGAAAGEAMPDGCMLVKRSTLEHAGQQAKLAANCIVGFARDNPGKMCGYLDDACTAADVAAADIATMLAAPQPASPR